MRRDEFVQRLIVNAMCDDYENLDQVILGHVTGGAAKCGVSVDRTEVVLNLRVLIEAGLVKAYDLSAREPLPLEMDCIPSLDTPEKDFRTYFYPTPTGLKWHKSDDTWWPFDDDVLRADWDPELLR